MSAWGRAQDALGNVLWGYEISQAGDRVEGAFDKLGLTYAEVKAKCPTLEEDILEALASVVGYWTADPSPSGDRVVREAATESDRTNGGDDA